MSELKGNTQIIAELRAENERLRLNHKDVVETKRGTDARLKTALAGLQQIYTVCGDDAPSAFIRQIAGEAFEAATKNLPRSAWDTSAASTLDSMLSPVSSPPRSGK